MSKKRGKNPKQVKETKAPLAYLAKDTALLNFDFDHETLGFIFTGLILGNSKSNLQYFFGITKERWSEKKTLKDIVTTLTLVSADDSYYDVLSFLLDQKSVIEFLRSGNIGNFCLSQAAGCGALSNLKLFLEKGFNPSFKSTVGKTAIHGAVTSGKLKVLETVLKYTPKGDHDLPDNQGFTPFALAKIKGHKKLAESLEKLGVKYEATITLSGEVARPINLKTFPIKAKAETPPSAPPRSEFEKHIASFAANLLETHHSIKTRGSESESDKSETNTNLNNCILDLYKVSNSTPSRVISDSSLLHVLSSISEFAVLSVTNPDSLFLAGTILGYTVSKDSKAENLFLKYFLNHINNSLMLYLIADIEKYQNMLIAAIRDPKNELTALTKASILLTIQFARLFYDTEAALTSMESIYTKKPLAEIFTINPEYSYAGICAYLRLGEVEQAKSIAKISPLSSLFLNFIETYNNEWSKEKIEKYLEEAKESTVLSQTDSYNGLILGLCTQIKGNIFFHQQRFSEAQKEYGKTIIGYPLSRYLNLEKTFAIICDREDKQEGLRLLQKFYANSDSAKLALNTPEILYYQFLFHEWNGLSEEATSFLQSLKQNPGTAYKNHYITEAVKVRVVTLVEAKQYTKAEEEMSSLKAVLSAQEFDLAMQEFKASTNVLQGISVQPQPVQTSEPLDKTETVQYLEPIDLESKHYNIGLAIKANDVTYLSQFSQAEMHEYYQHYKHHLFTRDVSHSKPKTSWLYNGNKYFSDDDGIIEVPNGNKEYILVTSKVFRKLDTLQQKSLENAVATGIAKSSHGAKGVIRDSKGFFEVKSLDKGFKDLRAYADMAAKNPSGCVLYIVNNLGNHKDVAKHANVKIADCPFADDHKFSQEKLMEHPSENNNNDVGLSGFIPIQTYDMEGGE